METMIYLLIFVMGTFMGSFFTLATYRLPLGENIVYKHSYCPNCKHELGILDLFPIFSYLFLGGKCRYCKKTIKIRYLLFEVLSGIVFLLFAISLHINWYAIDLNKIVLLGFGMLYFVMLFLIAGIDKEQNVIQRSVITYGLIVVTGYILYLYIVQKVNIYRYVIYLGILFILVLLDTFILRKKIETNYTVQILTLCIAMVLFGGEEVFVLTVITTLMVIAADLIVHSITQKRKKMQKQDLAKEQIKKHSVPVGYYLCVSNMAIILLSGFLVNYIK